MDIHESHEMRQLGNSLVWVCDKCYACECHLNHILKKECIVP